MLYLVEKGADINAQDKGGETSLDAATDQNHDDVVKYLKQAQLNEQLLAAAQNNDFSKVKDLVSQGANINAKERDGNICLHYASRFGDLDAVKYLISKDADIDAKDNNSRTPLDVADSSVIKILRQAHLDKELLLTVKSEDDLKTINSLIAKGINGSEDRHGAYYFAWRGDLDTVKFIVEREGSVNVADKYGCTLLHWSALKGHSDIAKLLVNKGANVNAKDILGRTPMHFAVMDNHKDIQDVYGRGSTYTTAEDNDEEVIQLFLMRGAGINEADKNGETPLHLASWGGHLDTLQHLINNGANIGTKDSSGKTPLDIARDKGHNNLVQYLQQTQLILDKQLLIAIGNSDLNKVRGLVAQGANIDTNDKNGNTLLYSAAEIGDLNLVKLLLDNGANVEAKNGKYQATPLHGAVLNERLSVVKLLLNRGANVNAEDKDNWTPLHYGADTNSLDIVKVLVDAHANLCAKGNYGKTPLDSAKDKGHNNIVEYLEKKLREERGKPLQRKRRHHHGDHARHHMSRKPLAIDQPKIAASSGTRPSLWINGLFGWVKGSVGGLFYSRAALSEKASNTASSIPQVDEQFAKASVSSSSSTSTTIPSDGTDKKQENGGFFRDNIDYVNANIKQMREKQTPVKFKPSGRNTILEMGDHYLSQVDFNGTIMLLDVLVRKVTGQKYISTVDQPISPLEAQGYALNITNRFEKVVEQAGLKSGVSVHRLNIDYMGMQKEITRKVMSGKFYEISGILKSYVEKACPGEKAGKLSPKKFEKFIAQFNKGLLNQSIEQILHNGDGRLEVDGGKQMSLEPQSYLSNASVQGHLTRDKVKLIS